MQYPNLPNQCVPESEWTEAYYKKNVEAIVYSYGVDNNSFFEGQYTRQKMYRNLLMYKGWQRGDEWAYMKQAVPGVGIRGVFSPGFEANAIITNWVGFMQQYINRMPDVMSVKSLNREVYSRYDVLKDTMTFTMQQTAMAQTMMDAQRENLTLNIMKGAGMQTASIPPNVVLRSEQEIEKFLQLNFKEQNELNAYYLGKAFMYRERWKEQFRRLAEYSLTTGIASVRIKNRAGHYLPEMEVVPPLHVIKDRRKDSDLGHYDQYGGQVNWYSKEQIIRDYDLTKDEVSKLDELIGSPDAWSAINGQFGFPIFFNQQGITMIAVADVAWKSVRESKFKTRGRRSNGDYKLREIQNGSNQRSQWTYGVIRQGSLIGGQILKNYGERENHPINNFTSEPQLPFISIMPLELYGTNTTMMDKIYNNQQLIDHYKLKLQQAVAKDYGRVLNLSKSRMDEDTDTERILYKLINESIIEESNHDGFSEKGSPLNRVLELGLSPEVSMYVQLIAREEQNMRSVTQTSDSLTGTQTQTMGKGVMESTIQGNTTGNMGWISSVWAGYNKIVQYATDQARMNLAYHSEEFVDTLPIAELGMGSLGMIKATPEMAYETIGLYFDFNDIANEADKAKIESLAQFYANTGTPSYAAMLEMSTAPTVTQKINILRADEDKIAMQKAREMEAAAAQNEYNQQAQTERTKLAVDTQADTTQRSVDGKIAETGMKEEGMDRRKHAELLVEMDKQNNNNTNSQQ